MSITHVMFRYFMETRRPRRVPPDRDEGVTAPASSHRASTFFGVLIASLALSLSARAHPIHRSIAEADYKAATATLEISLRVFADDFEAVLSTRAKKKISLETTPAAELDAIARAYLTEKFTVKSAGGAGPAFRWIGREFKDAENELWFYFEVSLPGGVAGTRIHHAVLADHFRDQLNSVLVRDGTRKTTMVFLPNHTEKTVRFPP